MDQTTTTTTVNSNSSTQYYRNNELYTTLLSILTAALLLFFIMWRWYRMKLDFSRAVYEFQESQNQQSIDNERDQVIINILSNCSNDQQKLLKDEQPPSYESIVKSSSLPNYKAVSTEIIK
jgi:hypothetical protein